jgi:thioredoxin-like negative regulator of GroEL
MKAKRVLQSIALSLLFLISPVFAAHPPQVSEKMTGQSLPSFNTQTLDGKSFTDQSAKGPILFNFFASWCPPCRRELTFLRELNATYGGKIKFIGVLIDPVESPETMKDARSLLAQNPLPYPVLMMTPAIKESFKFEGIPTVYLVDKSGKFSTTLYGPQPAKVIEQHIQKVLSSK